MGGQTQDRLAIHAQVCGKVICIVFHNFFKEINFIQPAGENCVKQRSLYILGTHLSQILGGRY